MTNLNSNCTTNSISRILSEKPIYSDHNLHLVYDANPITSDHLLLLSKTKIRSFSDHHNIEDLSISLASLQKKLNWSQTLFFEKGRASFCTSMQSSHHAHAHIFDSEEVDKSILTIAEKYECKQFKSITAAFDELRLINKKYILFGEINIECFAIIEPSPVFNDPLFLRSVLKQHAI